MKRLFLLLMVVLVGAFYLGSCCSEDTTCPAGGAIEADFPYKFNQVVKFADTLGNSITVRMSDKLSNSEEYIVDGSCGVPRKDLDCSSSTTMQAVVVDSANILNGKKSFSAVIEKRQLPGDKIAIGYSLLAFGRSMSLIADYNSSNPTVTESTVLTDYTTPYKTYTNVYETKSQVLGSVNYRNKTVFDKQGKLIAFTLDQDTTKFFYAVE